MRLTTGLLFCAALGCAGCSRGGAEVLDDDDLRSPGPTEDLARAADLASQPLDLRRSASAEVSFGPAQTYPAGQFAYHIAIGRIDLDDLDDLLVSGRPGATVYLSKGDGTLIPKAKSLLGNWQVALADVNSDGKGDMLLTDTTNHAITVSLGKGDGDFMPPTAVPAGEAPQGVAAADLDGDRKVDLLAVDQRMGTLITLRGKGDGTFAPWQQLAAGMAPLWVATGDLNGDRRPDVVVSNLSSASFSVYLQGEDRALAEGVEVKTLASPVVLQLADLNLDGNLDVALNGEGAEHVVAVHLGDGRGGFQPPTKLALGAASGQGLAAADVNGDNIPDLVAVCAFTSPARVFLGNGDGTFLPEKIFPAEPKEYLAAAQFLRTICGDLKVDLRHVMLVPGNHDLNWLLSQEAYTLHRKSNYAGPLTEGRYIDEGGSIISVLDEGRYRRRFDPFTAFYRDLLQQDDYPQEPAQQTTLLHLAQEQALILGLNSCWEIDHHFRSRASIHPAALSRAIDEINRTATYRDSKVKIAVWHHPVSSEGEDRIKDHGFLERLAQAGFKLALHGHIHRAENGLYRFDHTAGGRRIELVGAGTFGAPTREWVPGYPLQYQLLRFTSGQVTVETRRREQVSGAWKPDARWSHGPGQDPLPRYVIPLS